MNFHVQTTETGERLASQSHLFALALMETEISHSIGLFLMKLEMLELQLHPAPILMVSIIISILNICIIHLLIVFSWQFPIIWTGNTSYWEHLHSICRSNRHFPFGKFHYNTFYFFFNQKIFNFIFPKKVPLLWTLAFTSMGSYSHSSSKIFFLSLNKQVTKFKQ